MHVLCNRIILNRKQMKPSEKSITLAVSLTVAAGNVKYIRYLSKLVTKQYLCRWRNILTESVSVPKSSHPEVF